MGVPWYLLRSCVSEPIFESLDWYIVGTIQNTAIIMSTGEYGGIYVRDRSCLLRCSDLLKARWQNWHLYFRSGAAREGFREAGVDAASVAVAGAGAGAGGRTARLAPGILYVLSRVSCTCAIRNSRGSRSG